VSCWSFNSAHFNIVADLPFPHDSGDAAPIQSLTAVDASKPSQINAFDVVEHNLGNGHVTYTLENKRAFAWSAAGIVDGLKTDADGNVYGAMSDGIQVWNSAGTELFKIYLPGGTSVNFVFAGDGRLFVTGQTRVWVIDGLAAKSAQLQNLPPKSARVV
jgi:SMP-30/Gluconolactonase/LRE-like region